MSPFKIATLCVCLELPGAFLFADDYFARQPAPVPAVDPGDEFSGAAQKAPTGQYTPSPSAPVMSTQVYEPSYADYGPEPAGGEVVSSKWLAWYSKLSAKRKAPFQRYNHHPGDLQPRAVASPLCSSTWGYHETCWRSFPQVPVCQSPCPVYTVSKTPLEPVAEPTIAKGRPLVPISVTQRR